MSILTLLYTLAFASPTTDLLQQGFLKDKESVKHCSQDYSAVASIYSLSPAERIALCVSQDIDKTSAKILSPLKLGRNATSPMSELVVIHQSKKQSVCSHEEIKEFECAVFIEEKKIDIIIHHPKMLSIAKTISIDCKDGKCLTHKKCSIETPISESFKKEKLSQFKKQIHAQNLEIKKYQQCLSAHKKCSSTNIKSIADYTLDEQQALQRLAIKEDHLEAEDVLNWYTLGANCKTDCLSAADFFDDQNCKY